MSTPDDSAFYDIEEDPDGTLTITFEPLFGAGEQILFEPTAGDQYYQIDRTWDEDAGEWRERGRRLVSHVAVESPAE
jgi:hypothetical protein